MASNITPPRVPLVDLKSGLVSREWYNFFLSIFRLTGAGQPAVSLVEVTADIGELQSEPVGGGLVEQVYELTKAVQELQEAPPVIPHSGTLVLKAKATLDFPSTAAAATSDLTMSVPGAVDGDVVCLSVPNASVPVNGTFFAWVSAADTVTVRYANNSGVAQDPASGEFRVVVTRF